MLHVQSAYYNMHTRIISFSSSFLSKKQSKSSDKASRLNFDIAVVFFCVCGESCDGCSGVDDTFSILNPQIYIKERFFSNFCITSAYLSPATEEK